jgi:CBS domain-containing protein
MQGHRFESATTVYVLDNNTRLIGLVPLHRLLTDHPDRTMSDLMQRNPPIAFPDDDQEHVADIAVQHENKRTGTGYFFENGRKISPSLLSPCIDKSHVTEYTIISDKIVL